MWIERDKMRIGIDASGVFGWRGPGRNIRNLIRYLLEIDDTNEYFLFFPEKPSLEFSNKCKQVIVEKKKLLPWLSVSLPVAARKFDLDLFFFPQSNYWLWKQAKTIIYTRTAKIDLPWSDSLIEKLQLFLKKQLFNTIVDAVVCNSNFNRTQIQLTTGISEEKCSVVYNGVDPIFFDSSIEPCKKYGNYILYVGGTEKRKNIQNLLKAYKILSDRGIHESLVLVGGGYVYYEKDLKELVAGKMRDRCLIHGIENDSKILASLYKGAELVVFPSFQEDFGNISVEAMASGVPLAASFMPSIPEVAGNAAIYFNPYDPVDMADKIQMILNDKQLQGKMITDGIIRANKFLWEESARKLIRIFNGMNKS